jgi:hypothetical protein
MSRDTETLPFRLPGPKRRAWGAGFVIGVALAFILLALAVGLGALAVLAFRAESPLGLLPAIGSALGGWLALWILVKAATEVWTDSCVAPTVVEVSDATLHPGQVIEVAVEQAGPLRCKEWRVALVAREQILQWAPVADPYNPQGTVDQPFWTMRRVGVVEVTGPRGLLISQGDVWRDRWTVRVAENAVPSSSSRERSVEWAVEITGDVNGWPKFTRRFPVSVTVVPAAEGVASG